ncbi:uncharacterized membrane-anchored protein YjiN (DUF445 family) [Paenibacillus endophyticus]|uniref:Uncharacterized membrane-anchored protein YjiN (DUF445 family) n=1 Tax=Paenibacillus endophyticus TaxID=1294268 RepID=A0A7W5C3R3_9BACL|nr:DUF445 domain-containing protein [Paenibacillus endophyticus]MBB3150322.1 uncharacterized membrane-anchored protein YjiN (DUF445 family) [Paenibacillus endophyticus]
MNNFSIKKKADLALLFSAIGIFVAFPFHETFVGGLLFSLFSAATIGGLADSFAVSALFGNPLRIKWPAWMGTNIISRNRERLIGELVKMVQNDLLTIPNIKERLDEYNIAEVLVTYLKEHGGEEGVNDILQQVANDVITTIDLQELAKTVQTFLLEHADSIPVSNIAADVGDWTIRNGYDDRIIEFMIPELIKIVKSASFGSVVDQIVKSAIKSYEGDKFRRKLIDFTAGLEAANISGRLQDWLVSFLEKFHDEDHPQRKQIKAFIAQIVVRLRTDEQLRERIEAGKLSLLAAVKSDIRLDVYIERGLEALRKAAADNAEGQLARYPWIKDKVREGVSYLESNSELLERIDQYVKTTVLKWMEQKHSYIGKLVTDKLNDFSEEELISLVKEKAGKDLQYIRINGIGVGALIGVVLHLATFWIGGHA